MDIGTTITNGSPASKLANWYLMPAYMPECAQLSRCFAVVFRDLLHFVMLLLTVLHFAEVHQVVLHFVNKYLFFMSRATH